jgi:hypothetical protein
MPFFLLAQSYIAALAWFAAGPSTPPWVLALTRPSRLRRAGTWTIHVRRPTRSSAPPTWPAALQFADSESRAVARLRGYARAYADLMGGELRFLLVRRDSSDATAFLLRSGLFDGLPAVLRAPLAN